MSLKCQLTLTQMQVHARAKEVLRSMDTQMRLEDNIHEDDDQKKICQK